MGDYTLSTEEANLAKVCCCYFCFNKSFLDEI